MLPRELKLSNVVILWQCSTKPVEPAKVGVCCERLGIVWNKQYGGSVAVQSRLNAGDARMIFGT